MNFLLNSTTMPYWITSSFPVIRIVLICIIAISAILLTITTLMQSNENESGSTALTGQDSYYAKNKGESKDVRLSRATIILVSTMFVCMVVFFVSLLIYHG